MSALTSRIAGLAAPIVIIIIVGAAAYALYSNDAKAVTITSVQLLNSYTGNATLSAAGCDSFNLTSGTVYSSLTSITLTGTLHADAYCHVAGAGVQSDGFGYVSSNTPLTLGKGTSATLSMVVNSPYTYDGALVICIYNGSWDLSGTNSCP